MQNRTPLSFFPSLSPTDSISEIDPVSRIFTEAIRIVRTKKGSHFEDANFGTTIHTFISTINTPELADLIRDDVQNALNLYLPEYAFAIKVSVIKETYVSFFYKILLEIDELSTVMTLNSKSGEFV